MGDPNVSKDGSGARDPGETASPSSPPPLPSAPAGPEAPSSPPSNGKKRLLSSSSEEERMVTVVCNDDVLLPWGRHNALVPERDARAAVQAMERTLARRVAERREQKKRSATEAAAITAAAEEGGREGNGDRRGGEPEEKEDDEEEEESLPLRLGSQWCLVASLYRVSQIVPDDLYHEYVREYSDSYQLEKKAKVSKDSEEEIKGIDGGMEDGSDDDFSEDDSSTEEEDEQNRDENDDDDAFEPPDLFDLEAQAKLERNQQQVQRRAKDVQSVRSSVISLATQVAVASTRRGTAAAPAPPPARAAIVSPEEVEELKRQAAQVQETLVELQRRYDGTNEQLFRKLKELQWTSSAIATNQLRNPSRRIDELMRKNFAAPPAGLHRTPGPVPEPDERLEAYLLG
jgi:hypothetical protein